MLSTEDVSNEARLPHMPRTLAVAAALSVFEAASLVAIVSVEPMLSSSDGVAFEVLAPARRGTSGGGATRQRGTRVLARVWRWGSGVMSMGICCATKMLMCCKIKSNKTRVIDIQLNKAAEKSRHRTALKPSNGTSK